MKKYFAIFIAALVCSLAHGESYEGVLKIEYKDESGKSNSAEIFIKGDKYFIKKVAGGCEKYSAYLLDAKTHNLSCMSDHTPKTAVVFNTDKVLALYEKNRFKPGYKMHESQAYKPISSTKQISEITVSQKKAALDTMAFEAWTAEIKVDFHTLIPVLRIAEFWNKLEDGSNAILEGKTTNIRTTKTSTVSITLTKMQISDKLFEVPKEFQVVDLNKFIIEQASSPKLGDLVRAFAGF